MRPHTLQILKIQALAAMSPAELKAMRAAAPLPPADCDNCFYRDPELRDEGHCYMFRDRPDDGRCGQFKNTKGSRCTSHQKIRPSSMIE